MSRSFFPEENNLFNKNKFLETSNDLDDSEISSFIEKNQNKNV